MDGRVAALEARDLAAVRGGRRVFAGVAVTAPAGAVTLIRGPNGVGKSSLLRVLAGMTPPEHGAVALALTAGGRIVLGERRDAYLERIAYAGHADALKPTLSLTENLAFWARLYGAGARQAAERAAAALERFSLGALADAPAGACSAGQKRRLGLARLAVVDRPVWLLDEPTVSLDAASAAAFAALVSSHCAGGGVAVIATHIALPWPEGAAPEVLTLDMSAKALDRAATPAADPFLEGDDWR